jgi:hypothetical protein
LAVFWEGRFNVKEHQAPYHDCCGEHDCAAAA